MADDNYSVTVNPGELGPKVAADKIGDTHHQRVKVQFGTTGVGTDVSASNPLPVMLPNNPLPVIAQAVTGGLEVVNEPGEVLDVAFADPVEVVNAPGTVLRTGDFFVDVSVGAYPNLKSLEKFGENNDIDSGDETVWSSGGRYVYPDAAYAVSVVSDSANDTAAGTGARFARIYGLDDNWLEVEVDVIMTGTTPVLPAQTLRRINRVTVLNSGSSEYNEGTITVTGGGFTYATIEPTIATTLQAVWTCPAEVNSLEARALVTRVWANLRRPSATGSAQATIRLCVRVRPDLSDVTCVSTTSFAVALDGSSHVDSSLTPPSTLPGPFDIEVFVTNVSDTNTIVSAGFALIYGAF